MTTNILIKKQLSIKAQTFATIISVVAAVALPHIFHIIGAVSGLNTGLGEAFLPMHLPIILTGLIAGPYAGAISGAISPLLSFALSGMPGLAMLPFMMIELFVYGLASGLMKNIKMPCIIKVLSVQVAGRAVRAAAILIATYGFGYEKISVSIIYTSIAVGLFGIILQLVLIPLIIYRITDKNEQ